ncbi:hypothetical protein [Brevibacillus laterosporus]|uniref:hypothetical protein n=1 Tax=Brevibacillus laterosporus TaxID=1465 RepID=UPI00215C2639|nr:hypothetical protein [Brevibacillus laterosporus]MCR8994593.1 hypothetical protein [Brevibacillus laterosporus]
MTNLQKRTFRRLIHLGEFAPCKTVPLDYELEQRGYVKISEMEFEGEKFIDTKITHAGVLHMKHLGEERDLPK